MLYDVTCFLVYDVMYTVYDDVTCMRGNVMTSREWVVIKWRQCSVLWHHPSIAVCSSVYHVFTDWSRHYDVTVWWWRHNVSSTSLYHCTSSTPSMCFTLLLLLLPILILLFFFTLWLLHGLSQTRVCVCGQSSSLGKFSHYHSHNIVTLSLP